eukprot:CAMPEP_0168845064 /NCGR_PEP_ID=MMETSP0727-20121128/9079_1 /TAXON_ID=265536 /ORGANISM="Amphiprora sp., Strain CCMP467" /LENGTH=448 /DNA_ID=CAMNT_0008898765 /DNA_START=32 /DNA_END=1375 /DNA_ORIENTATION=+
MAWLEPENFKPPPKWRVELNTLLDSVDPEGDFYVSIDLPNTPRVHVEGLDYFSTYSPEKLKKVATKAAYGKGNETVVDESVRNTWKVDSNLVTASFKSGDFEAILERVKEELGLKDIDVEARLHNMLLYEKGSFFKTHTDTEKEKGMFATMAIQLCGPPFEGGSMKIQHKEKVKTINLSDYAYKGRVVAWYADCPHEIKPIESGSRCVLVYNLVQSKSLKTKVSVTRTEVPSDVTPILKKLYPIMDVWKACNEKIRGIGVSDDQEPDEEPEFNAFAAVLPLDHQYTMACFQSEIYWEQFQEVHYNKIESNELDESRWMETLKGRDRSIVRVLKGAGMKIELYVQEVQTTICSDGGMIKSKSTCFRVEDGELVKTTYQPRGYCGSRLFVLAKNNWYWLNDLQSCGKLQRHYKLLASGEVEPSGNEGVDGHGVSDLFSCSRTYNYWSEAK